MQPSCLQNTQAATSKIRAAQLEAAWRQCLSGLCSGPHCGLQDQGWIKLPDQGKQTELAPAAGSGSLCYSGQTGAAWHAQQWARLVQVGRVFLQLLAAVAHTVLKAGSRQQAQQHAGRVKRSALTCPLRLVVVPTGSMQAKLTTPR